MASNDQGKTQEKTVMEKVGEAAEAIKVKAVEVKDQVVGGSTQASVGSAPESKDKAGSYVKEKTDETKKVVSESAQTARGFAEESKDTTAANIKEKTEEVKKIASETAQHAREATQTNKDKTGSLFQQTGGHQDKTGGNLFQQTGGQVMGAAQGAADTVKRTLGFGGGTQKDGDQKDPTAGS